MNVKERFLKELGGPKKIRRKMLTTLLLIVFVLFCGFGWSISFSEQVAFPAEDLADLELVSNFGTICSTEDFLANINNPQIAADITQGVKTNIGSNIYNDIEITNMADEENGVKVVTTALDRLFK